MEYGKYLEKQKLSDADKESIWKEIHKYAKDYEPYEEKDFFYDDVASAVDEHVRKIAHDVPEKFKKDAEDLENSVRVFRDDIYRIAKPVMDKYEGKYVKDIDSDDGAYLPAYYTVDDFIRSEFKSPFLYPTLKTSSSDPIDYWVLNSKAFSHEYEKLSSRIFNEFSLDEYYKRYGYN